MVAAEDVNKTIEVHSVKLFTINSLTYFFTLAIILNLRDIFYGFEVAKLINSLRTNV
jgi:hypothetical protein